MDDDEEDEGDADPDGAILRSESRDGWSTGITLSDQGILPYYRTARLRFSTGVTFQLRPGAQVYQVTRSPDAPAKCAGTNRFGHP